MERGKEGWRKERKEGEGGREGGREAGTYLAIEVVVEGWVLEGVEARGDRADDV